MKATTISKKVRLRGRIELGTAILLTATCFRIVAAGSEELEVAGSEWRSVKAVDQRDFAGSINACGPAAILNLLKLSRSDFREAHDGLLGSSDTVRLQFFVDRYFKGRRSLIEPKHRRWGVHGVYAEDLAQGLNEFLEEKELIALSPRYLNRDAEETSSELVQRVHQWMSASLKNGVAPILGMRVFVVRTRDGETEPAWHTGPHHNVVVVSMDREPSDSGFSVHAVDSWGGRVVEVTIHREALGQGFRAVRGSGDEGEWLAGEPFLQVSAPKVLSLRPADLEWSERLVVTAHFLIGDY